MSDLLSTKRAAHGIRTAIVSKCDEALKSLSGRTVSAEDIHSARKALKKARAWLRLLRTGTSPRKFREHNHLLRDAARPLSEGRDAEILIETLHKLLKRYHEPAQDRRFGRFERALQKDRRAIQHRLVSSRTGVAASRRILRRSKTALTGLPIKGKDWSVIGTSFKKVYARGRKNCEPLAITPRPNHFMNGAKTRRTFGINFRCSSRSGQALLENGPIRPTT